MSRNDDAAVGAEHAAVANRTDLTSVCSIAAPIVRDARGELLAGAATAPPAQTMPREPQAPLE